MADIEKRLKDLEDQVAAFGKNKPPIDKKSRKPSAYNDFMKKFIETEKKKDPLKSHQELFKAGAKSWSETKKV